MGVSIKGYLQPMLHSDGEKDEKDSETVRFLSRLGFGKPVSGSRILVEVRDTPDIWRQLQDAGHTLAPYYLLSIIPEGVTIDLEESGGEYSQQAALFIPMSNIRAIHTADEVYLAGVRDKRDLEVVQL